MICKLCGEELNFEKDFVVKYFSEIDYKFHNGHPDCVAKLEIGLNGGRR